MVLEEMRKQEMFIERLLDGQTDAGEFPDRKKSSSGLRLEDLIIYKSALKRALKLDRRYPSMPEPTGGLGGLPRPTYIISSNTFLGNSNIPEYAYDITC